MEKQYRLPKEFSEKWLAALRSGEYQQGQYSLYNDVKCNYCCLGVACIVGGLPKERLTSEGAIVNDDLLSLPNTVPNELIGDLSNGIIATLTRMNDSGAATFPEIADWIEANVELY